MELSSATCDRGTGEGADGTDGADDKVKRDVISYSSVGIISLVFITLLIWRFSSKISSVIDREMEESRLKAAMELAGAAAHEMRQPLSVVIGLSGILEDKVKKGEDEIDIDSINQCLCHGMVPAQRAGDRVQRHALRHSGQPEPSRCATAAPRYAFPSASWATCHTT